MSLWFTHCLLTWGLVLDFSYKWHYTHYKFRHCICYTYKMDVWWLYCIFSSLFLYSSLSSTCCFFLHCFPPFRLSSLLSVWQPSRNSRSWTRRRAGLLPDPFLLLPPHLPPCPMPAKWCWLRVLLAGSQSGGYAKRQPIIADRALLPPPTGTRRCCPTIPAERQLQLWKPEHWAANPSGSASESTTASVANHQPGDSELESQRSSGGAKSGFNTSLDTGIGSLLLDF